MIHLFHLSCHIQHSRTDHGELIKFGKIDDETNRQTLLIKRSSFKGKKQIAVALTKNEPIMNDSPKLIRTLVKACVRVAFSDYVFPFNSHPRIMGVKTSFGAM